MKLKKSGKGTEQYMKPTMEIIEISDNMIMTSGTGTGCYPDTSCPDTSCPPDITCSDRENTVPGF